MSQQRQRLRLRYRKDEVLMYVGHRDLLRFVLKLLRKTQFPFATSGKFSPKPRVTFGPALPLGLIADRELLDIELADGELWDSAKIAEMKQALAQAASPRDFVIELWELDTQAQKISSIARKGRYMLSADCEPGELEAAFKALDLSSTNKRGLARNQHEHILRYELAVDGIVLDGHVDGEQSLNAGVVLTALRRQTELNNPRMRRLSLLDADGNPI